MPIRALDTARAAPGPSAVLEAIRDWGVEVAVYEPDGKAWHSWTTPGGWSPIGVMLHHTGGSAKVLTEEASQAGMLRLLRVGRTAVTRSTPELPTAEAAAIEEHLAAGFTGCGHDHPAALGAAVPGPLCHFAPAMIPGKDAARLWAIGWGNVNHAGMGASSTLSRARVGEYAGQTPGADDTDGNPWWWGLEHLHPGTTSTWPDPLLEVGHRTACALCEVSGWSPPSWPGSCVEHKEWTRRKIDRSWTGDLRDAIRRVQENPMPTVDLTAASIEKVAEAVAKYRVPNLDPKTGEPGELGIQIGTALSHLERWEDQERGKITEVLGIIQDVAAGVTSAHAEVTALRTVLDAIVSAPGGLTAEQLKAVAAAGAREVLAQIATATA